VFDKKINIYHICHFIIDFVTIFGLVYILLAVNIEIQLTSYI